MNEQEKAGIEVEILRHAEVMVGNCKLPEKSAYRREGIRKAQNVLRDLIAIRMDRMLKASKPEPCPDPEAHEKGDILLPCDHKPQPPEEGR